MKRFLVETPHKAEDCQMVIREVHAMGYLHYFEWGCESGIHCGWGFVEAENEQGAQMTVPSIVRSEARVVEVTKFGSAKGREIHGVWPTPQFQDPPFGLDQHHSIDASLAISWSAPRITGFDNPVGTGENAPVTHSFGEGSMGKLLFVGTFGSDDPTRASMPFIVASGGLDRGHEAGIVLMGEAVYLLKDSVVDAIQGVGFPPLRGPFDKIVSHGVPIYAWNPCSVARGVTEADLEDKNARFIGPDELTDLMMEADRVLSFWWTTTGGTVGLVSR